MTQREGPCGWWILTDVSVAYEPHECPSHDLAGWQRERLPDPPDGVIDLPPDWVCEILSSGHEKKDTVSIALLLQRHRVSRFWLIWPEEQALIAHRLDENGYRVIATLTPTERGRAQVPPFEEPDGVLARGWRS
jgi:Uma2 family endonuclease